MQRIFMIVGGPLDGHAFRPTDGYPLEGQVLELEGDDYVVRRVPPTRDRLMLPRWVLVHWTMLDCDLVWQAFVRTMRAYAAEALR